MRSLRRICVKGVERVKGVECVEGVCEGCGVCVWSVRWV